MLLMIALLLLLTLALAFANGANDVSKGIATLVGSGVTSYRAAVTWGSVATFAGAITAASLTQRLVATFSGKGIVTNPTDAPAFLLAVAVGAIGWLMVATLTGMPVSTTHSLVGALVGAGLLQAGLRGVIWKALIGKVAAPLLFSPIASLVLVIVILPLMRPLLDRSSRYCVCVEQTSLATPEGIAFREAVPSVAVGEETSCAKAVARVSAIDAAHWISSGATSFFRAVNDTPKIVALGIAAAAALSLAGWHVYLLVAAAMALGSLVAGFRVTATLARKVTRVTPENGLIANLATSILVAAASRFVLPVSTTHVSTGAIVGIGAEGSGVRWKMVGEMLLAWLVTLPVSGALAAVALTALR
jgi:PiT family inorganic phosphate transporter